MPSANPKGVYVAAHFGLELDGKQEVSLFRSVEGGGVKADVMTYQYGANDEKKDFTRWRMLGKPRFEDLKLQVGMSMSEPFFKWIEAFFKAQPDTPAKLAGFAYAFEALETGAYELLTRTARRAGDEETAAVAERILAEERTAAERVASTWDEAAELALAETVGRRS